MIKLRIILESDIDVIREINIDEDLLLEKLHLEIINLFNLDKFQMASFYLTDDNLNVLNEITIFDTKEDDNITMTDITIKSVLNKNNNSIIYVYDFLNMWRFHIQYLESTKQKYQETVCTYSLGELPEKAPKINFESNYKDLGDIVKSPNEN